MPTEPVKSIYVGYYFVAFIDIVGQREKLKAWASLPRNVAEVRQLKSDLEVTSEYVKALRSQFDDMYASAAKSTGLLDHLDANKRAWVEGRKQSNIWRRGFSDSYVMTVPCWYEREWGLHAGDIYYSLLGICGIFIWALAMEKPFRGGVEIGLGTEIAEQEVYGPIAVQAYELESKKAKWPRVLIGDGLMDYLGNLEMKCRDDLDGRHTKLNIDNCRGLIATSKKGQRYLDVMGAGVHSVYGDSLFVRAVEDGYRFVVRKERQLAEAGSEKLRRRYSQLRIYCESRLPVWGLSHVSNRP
jgi:hypothetical protein